MQALNRLEKLQKAESLIDFSKLLGYTPKGMSYILYKLEDNKKYRIFEVPKKTGGMRIIKAPEKRLSLLQKRPAELLDECVDELISENKKYWHVSHGFQKRRTIVSNAEVHRRCRFVFNVDIEDFFGTINFGRVRGFFIKDKSFSLNPTIATFIAQIACHDNALPQGSACSPIISNLIGNILDMRLITLARDAHCTYTRYADDLTFSTNKKSFPTDIAVSERGAIWKVGKKLRGEIERTGFKLNDHKTRMSLRESRQTVTGLVVNIKPNINKDHYRNVRSMCNVLFQKGEYYHSLEDKIERVSSLNSLEGMLSHIDFVKHRRDRDPKTNEFAKRAGEFLPPKAPRALYKKFLSYKYFAVPNAPLIITEGASDISYLKYAIRSLAEKHPMLAKVDGRETVLCVNFLKSSSIIRDVLNLGGGAGGQLSLIVQYKNIMEKFKHKPMKHPVIILCDNDQGAKNIFDKVKKEFRIPISIESINLYYYLCDNLYLIKIPEGNPPTSRAIETLFPSDWLEIEPNEKGNFVNQVIKPNWRAIDFSGFSDLLSRIESVIEDYKVKADISESISETGSS